MLGALTKALVLVRNAVLTVLMVDVSALNDEPAPSGNKVETGTKLPPPRLPTKLKLSVHCA